MIDIKKEYTLKEIIKKNNSYEIIYYDDYYNLPIKPNGNISVVITDKHFNEKKSVELVSNPVIIFELDDDNDEFEFDLDYVFDDIELNIGYSQIDKINDVQIKIYNIVYGLDIKKIGSKIYYPIPFPSLVNENGIIISKCKYHDIKINIKFSKHEFVRMIKSFTIRTELLSLSDTDKNFIDYKIFNNQAYKYYLSYFNDHTIYNWINTKIYNNLEQIQFVKINQNQFFELNTITNTNTKIKLDFNHNIDRFFIYFQNYKDLSIYTNTQQFEKIKFIVNNHVILEYDYDTLLYNNSKSILGYELPNGIFEIKWNTFEYKNLSKIDQISIQLNGLFVPTDVAFGICAENINLLQYCNDLCGLRFSC